MIRSYALAAPRIFLRVFGNAAGAFRIAARAGAGCSVPALAVLILLLISPAAARAQIITTVAGGGPNNVPATTANLNFNYSATPDSSGNVFIPDLGRCVIFKVDSSGTLTVFAGQMDRCGFGGDSGPATSAMLNAPSEVVADGIGDVFIADTTNQVVRRVDGLTGIITTYAGTPGTACATPTGLCGDGGAATSATLSLLPPAASVYFNGLALDSAGDLFIADTFDARI